jgi:hypothetical protein
MNTYSKDLTDNLLARNLSEGNKAAHIEDIGSKKVKASGVLTVATDIIVASDDTVTIGTTAITIEAAVATANSIVSAVDLDPTDAATSLKEFINGESPSVSGVTFNANTFNELVKATSLAGVLTVTADTFGSAGNAIATTETSSTASWAAVTLVGGDNSSLEANAFSTPATYANDAAAAAAGVPVGDIYRVTTTGVVQWRVA